MTADNETGVAELFRRSILNLVGSIHVGSNPAVEAINHIPKRTQLSILLRSVNEYSEVALKARAVMLQTHISKVPAHIPSLR